MSNSTTTFLSLASRSSSGNSSAVATLNYKTAVFEVRVSNVSGTSPSLIIEIQCSQDNSNWNTIKTLDAITGTDTVWYGSHDHELGSYTRISYTIQGTDPNITFSVIASLRD